MHKGTSFQLDKYEVLFTIPVLHMLNATGSLKWFFFSNMQQVIILFEEDILSTSIFLHLTKLFWYQNLAKLKVKTKQNGKRKLLNWTQTVEKPLNVKTHMC